MDCEICLTQCKFESRANYTPTFIHENLIVLVNQDLHQVGVSHAALARLSSSSPGEDVHRKQYQKAMNGFFRDAMVEIRLPLKSEPFFFSWWVMKPAKLMQLFIQHNEYYRNLVTEAGSHKPSNPMNPWRLIVYNDEVTAGNIMKADNKRKATAFYFAFHEFGLSLRDEDAWLCNAVIPYDKVKLVEGGLSCVLKHFLKEMFEGADSFSNGVAFEAEVPLMIFAKLSNLLADEAALKASFQTKGHSGLRPCLLCKNVVMKGELRLHDATGYLVSIDVHCLSLCDKASDADIWASADMLARSPKGELDKLEKATGLKHHETGFLRASFAFLSCLLHVVL